MMKEDIKLIKEKKTIKCIPKKEKEVCQCDKKKQGWPCTCTPGLAPCFCGPLIVVEDELEPEVVSALALDLQQGFWAVYRFDSETLRLASEVWSDDDLAFLWGCCLDGQSVFGFRKRARAEVSEDWGQFCIVEGVIKQVR